MTATDDGATTPARVVIAEDEAIVRLDLKEILLSAGYDVVGETGRGDEAVRAGGGAPARPGHPRREDAGDGRPPCRPRDHLTPSGGRPATHGLQPARPDRGGQGLGGVGLPRQALPAPGAPPGHCRRAGQGPPGPGHRGGALRRRGRGQVRDPPDRRRGEADPDGPARPPETEAFGFIQRTAMQTRARMRDVAQQVVDGTLTP